MVFLLQRYSEHCLIGDPVNEHSKISAIRIFGSAARGDADELSDTDVLVVQRTKIARVEKEAIEVELGALGPQISICWYSELTLQRMFREGHLFAWHLFRESINPSAPKDYVDSLGVPGRYLTARSDIRGFREIISGANLSLSASIGNACYEAGILFVCARNIAMIASSYLHDGPYFGRDAPYKFERNTGINFPLSAAEHTSNMIARSRAHRGLPVQPVTLDISRLAVQVEGWARCVEDIVQVWERDHEREKRAVC